MKDKLAKHFQSNHILYFLIIIILTLGISIGAISATLLNDAQKNELINYLNSFFNIITENNLESGLILKVSILNILKAIGLIWILSISIIGIPLLLLYIIFRGFILGFTTSFLFTEMGFKGVIFSLLAVMPQNLFLLPALVIITVVSLNFSLRIIKKNSRNRVKYSFINEVSGYTLTLVLLSFIALIGSLIEAFISPLFINLLK